MLPARAVLTVMLLWAGLASSSSAQRGGTAPTGGPREIWRVGANGHGRPVVGSGIVYFLSADHQVSALNAQTGRLVWSSSTGEPGQSTAGSAAALAGDTLVAGDYNLVAFDRRTGAFRWRFTPAIGYGPGIYLGDVTDRVVLSGSPAGRIYAIHARSGELAWSQSVAGSAATTVFQPATDGRLVAAGFTVFQAPNAGGVAAFDLASGRDLWRTTFPKAPDPLLGTGFGGGLLVTPDEIIASSGDEHDLRARSRRRSDPLVHSRREWRAALRGRAVSAAGHNQRRRLSAVGACRNADARRLAEGAGDRLRPDNAARTVALL